MCVYDLLGQLGLELRFLEVPSMEGLYSPGPPPLVAVSSLRPPGRQAFTCAHELGHHIFGHGWKVDELVAEQRTRQNMEKEEFLASCFAGILLMPKSAMSYAISVRGIELLTCDPVDLYALSTWFGVGYSTLVDHAWYSLQMITAKRHQELRRIKPKVLRSTILGRECNENLIVADEHWVAKPVDVSESDLILLSGSFVVKGSCVERIEQSGGKTLVRAEHAGIGEAVAASSNRRIPIRVSRKNYVGRGIYRFMEDAESEE